MRCITFAWFFSDAFLRVRDRGDHECTAMMKAQFLSLWDGLISDPSSRIVILGATNVSRVFFFHENHSTNVSKMCFFFLLRGLMMWMTPSDDDFRVPFVSVCRLVNPIKQSSNQRIVRCVRKFTFPFFPCRPLANDCWFYRKFSAKKRWDVFLFCGVIGWWGAEWDCGQHCFPICCFNHKSNSASFVCLPSFDLKNDSTFCLIISYWMNLQKPIENVQSHRCIWSNFIKNEKIFLFIWSCLRMWPWMWSPLRRTITPARICRNSAGKRRCDVTTGQSHRKICAF